MMGLSFCVGWAHSLQGDISAIVDSAGNLVVEYKYDAWGNITHMFGSLSGTLGEMNPFRYRGYVYDVESGLYYLRSRYYNPEWGRFINIDSVLGKVGGVSAHNVYCYCHNDPVSYMESHFGFSWYEVNHRMEVYHEESWRFLMDINFHALCNHWCALFPCTCVCNVCIFHHTCPFSGNRNW